MESISRPLGGVAALSLGVASLEGAAPTLPEGGVQIPLLEDRSTYSEVTTYSGASKSVSHSLKAVTAINFSLPEELLEGLTQGFVALISLRSLDTLSVGWSSEAASDRALRLVSCSAQSNLSPSERGYKEWLFESVDGAVTI